MRRSVLSAGISIALLALGVVGAIVLVISRPPARTRPVAESATFVRAVPARLTDERLIVRTAGTVRARTESDLVPEVSGRVSWISPSLRPGGFFEPAEALLRIEARDYELAVQAARAALERTSGELDLAERTLVRQQGLFDRGVSSHAALDEALARARVARGASSEAAAQLEQAQSDLGRTTVSAPFAGRVLDKRIDVGQFVARGTSVARVFAIDTAEIRLPIPDDELAFLDLPLDYRNETHTTSGPRVGVSARFAGREHRWQGRIVRTEGEIDPRTRMVHVVAEFPDPYARSGDGDRPPLAVGMFVEAEIEGQLVRNVVVLPRAALRDGSRVLVVDPEQRLRYRDVDVLRFERDRVILRAGLAAGELVCTSALDAVIDGMLVSIVDDDPAAVNGGAGS